MIAINFSRIDLGLIGHKPQRCFLSCPTAHNTTFPRRWNTRTALRSHLFGTAEELPLVWPHTWELHRDNNNKHITHFMKQSTQRNTHTRMFYCFVLWLYLEKTFALDPSAFIVQYMCLYTCVPPGMTVPTSCTVSTDKRSSESTRITP